MLPAFKTPTGIPLNELKIATGVASAAAWTKHASVLAEAGSVQLEFKYLSQLVDKPIYADTVQKAMDVLDNASKSKPGLYPVFIDPNTGAFTQGAFFRRNPDLKSLVQTKSLLEPWPTASTSTCSSSTFSRARKTISSSGCVRQYLLA